MTDPVTRKRLERIDMDVYNHESSWYWKTRWGIFCSNLKAQEGYDSQTFVGSLLAKGARIGGKSLQFLTNVMTEIQGSTATVTHAGRPSRFRISRIRPHDVLRSDVFRDFHVDVFKPGTALLGSLHCIPKTHGLHE